MVVPDAGRSACGRGLLDSFRARDPDCLWASGEEVAEDAARLWTQPALRLAVARQAAADVFAEVEHPLDALRAAGPEHVRDDVVAASQDAYDSGPQGLPGSRVSVQLVPAPQVLRQEPLARAPLPAEPVSQQALPEQASPREPHAGPLPQAPLARVQQVLPQRADARARQEALVPALEPSAAAVPLSPLLLSQCAQLPRQIPRRPLPAGVASPSPRHPREWNSNAFSSR